MAKIKENKPEKALEVVNKSLTFKERRDMLSFKEQLAFDALLANPIRRENTINPALIAGMYELFLTGKSPEEITKINQGSVSLGEVARLRVEDRWDERKLAYRETLEFEARERVKQTQLEGIDFLSIQMRAVNKRLSEQLLKYIATGDLQYFNGFSLIGTVREYKEAVDMLFKLTGQDKEQNINVSGQVDHKVTGESKGGVKDKLTPEEAKNAGLTTKQAAKVLAALLEDEPKEK